MCRSNPAISVIVPMYNVAPYLRQCLDSICSQSFKNYEAILIDDGSPDECGEIADEYAAKDSRFRVIHKENAGVSEARNDGIRESSGDYLFFLDSDDYLLPDALETLYYKAIEHYADVILSDYRTFSHDSRKSYRVATKEFYVKKRSSLEALQLAVFNMGPARIELDGAFILRGLGAAWHYLVKSTLVIDNDLRFDGSLALFDDGLFVLNVLERASSAEYVSHETYCYRYVPGSITRSFKFDLFTTYEKVYTAIERFVIDNDKSCLYKGISLRKLIYLNKSMETYFFNPQNPMSDKDRYRMFTEIVRSPSYSDAFRDIDIKHLGSIKSILLLMLIKMNLYKIYWNVKKIVVGTTG